MNYLIKNLTGKLIPILLVCISICVFSCDKEEDELTEESQLSYVPWEERIYNGINVINGQEIFDLEVLPINNVYINESVCMSDLPTNNFVTIKLYMFIPKYPIDGYQSGIELLSANRITIDYNNGQTQTQTTQDLYTNGSLTFEGHSEDIFNANITLAKFSVEAVVPSNYIINKDNMIAIRFPFILKYRNEQGEEVYSDEREYTLLNKIC